MPGEGDDAKLRNRFNNIQQLGKSWSYVTRFLEPGTLLMIPDQYQEAVDDKPLL